MSLSILFIIINILLWKHTSSYSNQGKSITINDITICTITDDPLFEVIDWVKHHKSIGFNIMMYYNGEIKDSDFEYFDALMLMSVGIKIVPLKGIFHQIDYYIDCQKEITTMKMFPLDTDEYLTINNRNKFINLINKYDQLCMNWMMCESTNRILFKETAVCEPNVHIKSIFNVTCSELTNSHYCSSLNKYNTNEQIIEELTLNIDDEIYINHYHKKSNLHWLNKVKKGRIFDITPKLESFRRYDSRITKFSKEFHVEI